MVGGISSLLGKTSKLGDSLPRSRKSVVETEIGHGVDFRPSSSKRFSLDCLMCSYKNEQTKRA